MQAAIYVRVSTEEQAKDGYGLAVQEERCRAMALVKGWDVAPEQVYRDEGISGTKDVSGRPGLAGLLAAVHAKQVDAVIVLALDRLGRKTRIILDLVDRITANGIEVVSCKESIDTTTPAGRFVLGIFAGLAQLERDNIVERTTGGRNQRGRVDGEKGGRVPFGYVRTHSGPQIDEDAARYVRYIFGRRTAGDTLREIADALNARDLASPQGGRWHASTVHEVLGNAAIYRGGTRGASPVCWPAIL